MDCFRSNKPRLKGSRYSDIERAVRRAYNDIAKKTKRNPYIRSVFFNKDKIFLTIYWHHLMEKSKNERRRRLRYFEAAIDLVMHTTTAPISKINPKKTNELLYRFAGRTLERDLFYVQIKHDLRTGNKFLISVFPAKKEPRKG